MAILKPFIENSLRVNLSRSIYLWDMLRLAMCVRYQYYMMYHGGGERVIFLVYVYIHWVSILHMLYTINHSSVFIPFSTRINYIIDQIFITKITIFLKIIIVTIELQAKLIRSGTLFT